MRPSLQFGIDVPKLRRGVSSNWGAVFPEPILAVAGVLTEQLVAKQGIPRLNLAEKTSVSDRFPVEPPESDGSAWLSNLAWAEVGSRPFEITPSEQYQLSATVMGQTNGAVGLNDDYGIWVEYFDPSGVVLAHTKVLSGELPIEATELTAVIEAPETAVMMRLIMAFLPPTKEFFWYGQMWRNDQKSLRNEQFLALSFTPHLHAGNLW